MYPLSFGINYYKYKRPQKGWGMQMLLMSFPGLFETLEDGPGNEVGYGITKWHVSEMKPVSTQ